MATGDSEVGVADTIDLAALTAVIQVIFNLDAVVNKR